MPTRNYVQNIPLQMASGHPLPISELHRDVSRRVVVPPHPPHRHPIDLDHRRQTGFSNAGPGRNASYRSLRHQENRSNRENDFETFMRQGDGGVGLSGMPPVPDVFVTTGLSGLPVRLDLATHLGTGLSGVPEAYTGNLIPTGLPPAQDPSHDPALDRFNLMDLKDTLPSDVASGRDLAPQKPQKSRSGHFGPLTSHPVTLTWHKASHGLSGLETESAWETQVYSHVPAEFTAGIEHASCQFGSSRQRAQRKISPRNPPPQGNLFRAGQQTRPGDHGQPKNDPVIENRVPVRKSSANRPKPLRIRRKPVPTPASEMTNRPNTLYQRVEGWLDDVKQPKGPEDSDRWMTRIRDETQVLWSSEESKEQQPDQEPDFRIFEESSKRGTKRSSRDDDGGEGHEEGHGHKRTKIFDTIKSRFSYVGSQATWVTPSGRDGRDESQLPTPVTPVTPGTPVTPVTPEDRSGPVKRVFSRISSRLSWNPLSVDWDDSNYTPGSRAQLRIGLVGNMSAGKSSIIARILDPNFEDWEILDQSGYSQSEYIKIATKDRGRGSVGVELYDVPGKYWELNGNIFLIPEIFDAVVLCFGLDDTKNLERVLGEWATRIRESHLKVPLYLVGTKKDMRVECPQLELSFLPRRKTVSQLEGVQAAQTIGAQKYMETCVQDFAETHAVIRDIVIDAVRQKKKASDANCSSRRSSRRLSQAFCLP